MLLRRHLAVATVALLPMTAEALPTAPFAPAQVLTVDDSGGADFVRLDDAVQAAVDGDTILVRTGSYDGFASAAKGLTILAEKGAIVDVLSGVYIFDLQPEQALLLAGLRIQGASGSPALTLENCAGSVVIDDSLFVGPPHVDQAWNGTAAVVQRSASVNISDSTFFGSASPADDQTQAAGAGLSVRESNISLSNVLLRGGAGADAVGTLPAERGGNGLELTSSDLNVVGSKSVGGEGGRGQVLATSCAGARGGDGVAAFASVATHRAFETVGGRGGAGAIGTSSPCPDGSDGQPWSLAGGKLKELPGPARSLDARPSPVRPGQTFQVSARGEVGDLAVLAYSAETAFVRVTGLDGLRLVGDPLQLLPLGLIPTGGSMAFDFAAPALPSATGQLTLHLQLATARADSSAVLGESDALIVLGGGI